MRVKFQAGALREAVDQVRATTEPGNPTFAGLYLEASKAPSGAGRIRLFTMKPGSKTLIAIPAEVEEEGKVVVRPDQILSGLKGHDSDALVSFNVSQKVKRLNGTCAGSRFAAVLLKGTTIMHDQISHLPINGTNGSRYSATVMSDVIKKAAWCAALKEKSGSTSVVDALEFKRTELGFKVMSTDGHIAVRVTVNTDLCPEEMTIPRVALETFSRLLGKHSEDEIHVIKGGQVDGEYNEIYFKFADIFFGASTSVQKVPNIEPIFTDELRQPTRVVIASRNVLQTLLGRLAGFADRDNPIIHFTLLDEKLTLSTGSADGNIVEELAIAYTGSSKYKSGEGDVSVAYQYISKILSSISNDMVTIGLRDDATPLIVADEGNDDINTRYMVSCVRPAEPSKTQDTKTVHDDAKVASDMTAEDEPELPVAASEPLVAGEADGEDDPFADLADEAAEVPAHEEQDDTIPV